MIDEARVGEGLATGVSRAADARARKAIKKVKIVGAKAFKSLSFHTPYEGRYGLPSELASFSFVHPPPRTADAARARTVADRPRSSRTIATRGWRSRRVAATPRVATTAASCTRTSAGRSPTPPARGWRRPRASDGGCYGYVWAPDGTFSVGEARCKLDEHGVTCTKEPRWTAAGWIAWPFAVVQSRPQREGTEGVRLTEIAKASPWKGLPAISVDGAAAILPVRNHDAGGEVNDYDYCDAGTTTCERQSMGHDQVTADVFEVRASNRLQATQYVPMPYWDVDDATTRLRTDYGMIELARTKGAVTVTVTDWNDFAMGTKTFAVGPSVTVLGVAIAQGPHPSLYVRFGSHKTKTSRPDDDWRFFALTLPPP